MKPLSYSLIAAALACGFANAQTTAVTTPVGYVTETLVPARDNLIGLTVHSPTAAAGVLDSALGNVLTDLDVDFSSLTAGKTYILEITNGAGLGYIQEVTVWTAHTLTTQNDISSVIVGNTTSYRLRVAPTIADIFGVNNSVGLTSSPDGSTAAADVILLPDGAGGFKSAFYYNDGTDQLWIDGSFNEMKDYPLVYTDGMVVARKAGLPLSLVITGEVKTTPTVFAVTPGDNYLGAVYPVGSELANSGMGTQLIPSPDGGDTASDLVYMPDGLGGYDKFMYYNDGTDQLWIDGSFNDQTTKSITSGFILRSRSVVARNIKDTPPAFYSTL